MRRARGSSSRPVGVAIGTVALGVWMLAGPASAHVEADPASVAAGSTDTITFNVEHGCGDSATVKLEMKLADGVTDAKPAAIDGWTSSEEAGVITWTGGPQPHDQPLDVPVEMTFPDAPGATLLFPLVQTCEQGETRWVDPPNPDGSEPEDPAPLVELTASAAGGASTTASVATTGAAATTAAAPTTAVGSTTTATAPATTATTSDDSSDNSAAVIAVIVIAVGAVVGVGAFLLFRSRQP
jgi:periplasmic copper chaperone A